MAYNVSIPYQSKKHKVTMQLSMLHAFLVHRMTNEMKVLSFMVRHSTGGVYVIKNGMRIDIAKAVGSTETGVRRVMCSLGKKGLIKYVTNGLGNNSGVYVFHKAIGGLCEGHEEIKFKFLKKMVVPKTVSA